MNPVKISNSQLAEETGHLHFWELRYQLTVVVFAAFIFFGAVYHGPALDDDVDSAQASIGRTMLESGDWVTPRLDGVKYFDKSPLVYWLIALSYAAFGVHDWAARIPIALGAILLAWLTARFGVWAFGRKAGCYAGLAMATCVGLFLFTRVLIPDVWLTLAIALTMWSFLRMMEDDEPHRGRWSFLLGASLAAGVLLKSLIAIILPAGGAFFYLLATRQLFGRDALARLWQRLRPVSTAAIFLAITLPWFVLAILRNPPYFDFTLQSGPGQYHGFFWRYFINEQLLRFLNRRYPHDYDTVPRSLFWLLNLAWLFPWSVYLSGLARENFGPRDRAGRVRLLALCWGGFVLLFFTFSTTQEYYSMPAYPALALLIGAAVAAGGPWIRRATRAAATLAGAGAVAALVLLIIVRNVPTPGDIVEALTQHPEAYTLSLGHMQDLTLRSFAYFRQPLTVAAAALLVGAVGGWICRDERGVLAIALMMAIFSQATRMALIVMEPELSSRTLADALRQSPPGDVIAADEYYAFSSVFFYANRSGFLLKRINQTEYASYAPGAPQVFLSEQGIADRWKSSDRCYLLADGPEARLLGGLVGAENLHVVRESGGKFLFSNRPLREAGGL